MGALGGRAGARFIVIDDNERVRDGLVSRLRASIAGRLIVHASDNLAAAVATAKADGCDCAIVDLDLGDQSSVAEFVSAFTVHQFPVLVVSALATPNALNAALEAGASGFVTKRSSSTDLEAAVRAVLEGRSWVAPTLVSTALDAGRETASPEAVCAQRSSRPVQAWRTPNGVMTAWWPNVHPRPGRKDSGWTS